MFRKKKIVSKQMRLVAIFDSVADGKLGIGAQSNEIIIDYLYDYYDGTDRHKFPEKRGNLEFFRNPSLIYPGYTGKQIYSWESAVAVNSGLHSRKSCLSEFNINICADGSFGTFVWDDDGRAGDWKLTPGLDDV